MNSVDCPRSKSSGRYRCLFCTGALSEGPASAPILSLLKIVLVSTVGLEIAFLLSKMEFSSL
jgi:hypothetical protein